MHTSEYFHHLSRAYDAELDDLRTDSEGVHVLSKRLAEKRREIGFLVQMLETSPEMVAVVLHQAFRFTRPAEIAQLAALEAEELPEWDSVCDGIELAPWADATVQAILQEPLGPWFMTVAAVLEFLQQPGGAAHRAAPTDNEADDEDADRGENTETDREVDRDFDGDDYVDDQASEEAGNDWLADQGFDRRD